MPSSSTNMLRKAAIQEPKVLMDQRSTIASSGPSIAPTFDFNPSSSETSAIVRCLLERLVLNYNQHENSRTHGVESPWIDNKTACSILCDALPTKKSVIKWTSPYMVYLATGGVCPPLSKLLTKKRLCSLPATLPIHVLIREALRRPSAPAVVEPASSYYRAIMKRVSYLPRNGCSSYMSHASASSMPHEEPLSNDILGTKEWAIVESELGYRFGAGIKVSKHCLTHSAGDLLRLALGFAAGLRSRTFLLGGDGDDKFDDIEVSGSSDDEDESLTKDTYPKKSPKYFPDISRTVETSSRDDLSSILLGELAEDKHFTPTSVLEIRLPHDSNTVDPSNALPHTVYKQTDRVLGKVRGGDHSSVPNPEDVDVSFGAALGILMTPGIESVAISFGCPAADVVPVQMDPTNFTPEGLCAVLRHSHFSSIVVDDTGFDLLARAHDLWRRTTQKTAWPVKVIITSLLFEECATAPEHGQLLSQIQTIELDEIIVKSLAISVSKLLRFRANLPYSITKITSDHVVHVYPRVLGLTYNCDSGEAYEPLWSNGVMSTVAGLMALKKHLNWSISRSDAVMMTRIETPAGEALDNPLNLEASATYHLAITTIALSGRIALVPLSRLMFQCHSAQDAIRRLRPTIAVGSSSTWAAFAKRLSHEAGIDGALVKSWKNRIYEKRCAKLNSKIDEPSPRNATHKHAVKEFLFRKLIDPVTFRHGRQLLGSYIRLAFVVDPLDGTEVMHEKTMATLTMLLSSSSDMKVVHSYSTTGLGGVPFAFVGSASLESSTIGPMTIPPPAQIPNGLTIHTGDPLFNERCTLDRRINLFYTPIPKELVDGNVAAPAIAGCMVNPSLEFMLSGVDEANYPLPSNSENTAPGQNKTSVDSHRITCRLSRAIRLSNESLLPLNMGTSSRVYITGGFAQMQDGLLSGPLYPRVCLDAKMRDQLRFNAISDYLRVHCFHVLKVNGMPKLTPGDERRSLLASSAARTSLAYEGHHHATTHMDLDIEINPLAPDVNAKDAQKRAQGVLVDCIRTRGVTLQRQLTGSALNYFALLWPQGLIPDVANSGAVGSHSSPSTEHLHADGRFAIEQVLLRHGSNLVIDKCTVNSHGFSA